jgi:hypothetical protein
MMRRMFTYQSTTEYSTDHDNMFSQIKNQVLLSTKYSTDHGNMFSQMITYYEVKRAVEDDDIQSIEQHAVQGFDFNLLQMELAWQSAYVSMSHPWTWAPLLFLAKTPNMIRTLVVHGADINAIDRTRISIARGQMGATLLHGNTLLHRVMCGSSADEAMVRMLISLDAKSPIVYGTEMTYTTGTAMRTAVYGNGIRLWRLDTIHRITAAMQLNVEAYWDEKRRIAVSLAFAQGLHKRLGVGSLVFNLDPDLLHIVLGDV